MGARSSKSLVQSAFGGTFLLSSHLCLHEYRHNSQRCRRLYQPGGEAKWYFLPFQSTDHQLHSVAFPGTDKAGSASCTSTCESGNIHLQLTHVGWNIGLVFTDVSQKARAWAGVKPGSYARLLPILLVDIVHALSTNSFSNDHLVLP